jgi:hypothetical protein
MRWRGESDGGYRRMHGEFDRLGYQVGEAIVRRTLPRSAIRLVPEALTPRGGYTCMPRRS